MNPLLWPGPAFLGFYAVMVVVGLVVVVVRRRMLPGHGPAQARLTDPYAVAWLRGGPQEVLRVATLYLVETHRVTLDGHRLQAVAQATAPPHEVPAAVFQAAAAGCHAHTLHTEAAVQAALARLRAPWEAEGYLPTKTTLRAFRRFGLTIIIALGGVALLKGLIAVANGHTNVIFLGVAAVIQAVVVWAAVANAEAISTPAGRRRLAQVQALFPRAHQRQRMVHATVEERCFVAALFGASVLGFQASEVWKAFVPPSQASSSGCGSSSDSGGGSGCGGGGCGGCGS